MEIGKPLKEVFVEPIELPEPLRTEEPITVPETVEEPSEV
jgi:hypothetical protein